jgi:hypothetical protein
MKPLIIIILIVVIAISIFIFSNQSRNTKIIVGSINDIEPNIDKIMKSNQKDAFLIVKIKGTDDFIQFTGDTKGVQLDFPLVTERQKSMEVAYKQVAKELNLAIVENRGSSGDNFLDINIKGTSVQIADISRIILEKMFKVNSSSKIEYELNL